MFGDYRIGQMTRQGANRLRIQSRHNARYRAARSRARRQISRRPPRESNAPWQTRAGRRRRLARRRQCARVDLAQQVHLDAEFTAIKRGMREMAVTSWVWLTS